MFWLADVTRNKQAARRSVSRRRRRLLLMSSNQQPITIQRLISSPSLGTVLAQCYSGCCCCCGFSMRDLFNLLALLSGIGIGICTQKAIIPLVSIGRGRLIRPTFIVCPSHSIGFGCRCRQTEEDRIGPERQPRSVSVLADRLGSARI